MFTPVPADHVTRAFFEERDVAPPAAGDERLVFDDLLSVDNRGAAVGWIDATVSHQGIHFDVEVRFGTPCGLPACNCGAEIRLPGRHGPGQMVRVTEAILQTLDDVMERAADEFWFLTEESDFDQAYTPDDVAAFWSRWRVANQWIRDAFAAFDEEVG